MEDKGKVSEESSWYSKMLSPYLDSLYEESAFLTVVKFSVCSVNTKPEACIQNNVG
jgi:hypothetical protein